MLASLICLAIVFVSGSRSGLTAFLVTGLFLFMSARQIFSIPNRLGIGLIIILISFIVPFLQPRIWFEDRVEIWATALEAGFEAPIFGQGFGNSTQILHNTSEKLQNNVRFQFIDSGHNIFLEYWYSGGLLGLGSLIILIFLSLKKLIKKQQIALIAAWLGLLTMFSYNPMSVVNLVELWWLIGLGLEKD